MSLTPPRHWEPIADRFEITELLDRYAHAIDAWDWELLATVFTPDAVVDFSSVGQYVEGEAKVRGFDAIVAWYKMALAPFFGVLHFMGNHLVTVDGDVARTKSYMHVLSMPMGGLYQTECVRTPAGWRITLLVLDERRFEDVEARLRAHMASVDRSEG
jgi:ketosteroid isomerase-like protein